LVDSRSAQSMERVNTLVKALMLRRTKDQKGATGDMLVPLPLKHEHLHKVALTAGERAVYDKIFDMSRSVLLRYLQSKGGGVSDTRQVAAGLASGVGGASGGGATVATGSVGGATVATGSAGGAPPHNFRVGHVLVMLLRLRQCCSHPVLVKQALEGESLECEGVEMDLVTQMSELSLRDVNSQLEGLPSNNRLVMDRSEPSTKIRIVLKMLRDICNKSSTERPMKSVIVSQWTSMLDIVASFLKSAGIKYSVIRGDVPAKQRGEIVHEFNTNPRGPQVMLVSLRAGGVGLNLIGANHLFLIDMHWNPALENQACDRIYRVGQDREVHIHRFVCEKTVEEKILDLQRVKVNLAERVMSGVKRSSVQQKLTLEELRLMFGV